MAGGKRPVAQGPNVQRFEFKSGLNGFKWEGMKLEGDPSNMATNKLRYLINGRMVDGVIVDRAGFANYNANTLGDSANCVFAVNAFDPVVSRLFLSIIGCPGSSGGAFQFIDPESNPERQTYATYTDAANFEPMPGRFGDDVYIGVKSKLYRSKQPTAEYGVTLPTGSVEDTLIYDFGLSYTINFIQQFDGSLYIGLENQAVPATSKIVKWDGKTITDELTGINAPRAACLFREFLVVGFAVAANHIRYRNQSGTWTTVAPGAGTISTKRSVDAMLSWRDNVYISSNGSTDIWKWTGPGGTLLAVRTVANAQMQALADFNNSLYYLYNSSTGPSCRIGKYDGTTFTDVHKNITTQFANDRVGGGMAAYKNQLFIGMDGLVVLASPGPDTGGTWLGTGSGSVPSGQTATNFIVI